MGRGDCGPAGSLCRRYRQEAGLTQRQLADAAGVSIGVVRDLEQGLTVRPRAHSARRLAAALCLDRSRAREFVWAVRGGPGGRPLPVMTGAARAPGLRLSILGPLSAWRDGLPVALGGGSQQVVLGLLALHPNSPLHRETIIDALWGDRPPATAVAMIQCCVSRLRRLLDPDRAGGEGGRVTRTGASYRLRLGAAELDQLAFTALADGARRAIESGEAARACEMYVTWTATTSTSGTSPSSAGSPTRSCRSCVSAGLVRPGYESARCAATWASRSRRTAAPLPAGTAPGGQRCRPAPASCLPPARSARAGRPGAPLLFRNEDRPRPAHPGQAAGEQGRWFTQAASPWPGRAGPRRPRPPPPPRRSIPRA